MRRMLVLLVVLWVGFSSAVSKPGQCPIIGSDVFGACVTSCGDDSSCKGNQLCCFTGCGQICQDPVCPVGVAKVECPQMMCAFSQCPNAPDAHCRIDSCGQCKVEYYNKTTWEKVTCTDAGQNLCERMRAFARAHPLPGRYVPTCTKEGKFESSQRRGSVLFCVDEETGIPDLESGVTIGTGTPDCSKKAKTKCQLSKAEGLEKSKTMVGVFVPECKKDGTYAEKQCYGSTGFCWCVDEKGREWWGSRKRGDIECPKAACPAGVKRVENCDTMICAAASCPAYAKSEVSCRINPCGQCKPEFLDKYDQVVKCGTCAEARDKLLSGTRRMIGQLIPQCDDIGNYKRVQCWGSTGYCWCVEQLTGKEVSGTRVRGNPTCDTPRLILTAVQSSTTATPPKPVIPVCPNGLPMLMCLRPFCQWGSGCASNPSAKCSVNPCKGCALEYFDENNNLVDCKKELTDCQLKRADALSSKFIGLQPVGRFIPKCEDNGDYSQVQCWGSTGYCWCVDGKTGVEQEMTRVRGQPNCAIKTNATMSVNKTVVKAGRCPTVQPTDTCSKKCKNDEDCSGKEKCCELECGKTCRAPAQDSLACPNGRPFLLCLHHCQLMSCPAHPRAKCNVDPCQMCKVEFKDDQGNVVNCSEKLTACQLQKASSPALLGSFRPKCEDDGRYKQVQCHGSIGYCWCVDENGQEINNTRQRGRPNCAAVGKKGLSKCEKMRAAGLSSGLLGAKIPQCEGDGRFKRIQSGEGYQWCVDEDGIEQLGTRMRGGKPDCKACSPVMCMMYCQYGFIKDKRGCEICQCARAPFKPGACPIPGEASKLQPVDISCTEDLDCAGSMKCCQNKCNFPVHHVKPGQCPRMISAKAGDCESKCSRDSDCSNDQKCCAKGCSRECMRPAKQVCPNGVPLVMCLRNMCDETARCSNHPEATCRMNYCGRCSVEFILANGSIAECGDDGHQFNDRVKCPGNQTMSFCSSSLCNELKCARNSKAKCRVPTAGCDCTPSFYDKKGNQVDCMTECQRKRHELESGPLLLGAFKPRCEPDGRYSRIQCSGSTGYCWCASDDGTKWPGTSVRGEQPECNEESRPEIRGVRVGLSLDADFNTVKDDLDEFKKAFIEHIKHKLGVHHEQINDLEVSSGSIVIKFVLVEYEDGEDARNVSRNLQNMVIEGEFVFEYGGQAMVAQPASYSAALKMKDDDDDDDESSSSAVLAIALGVVFGLLAIVLIVGLLLFVRRRSARRDSRGMSVNTFDSSIPLHK